MADSKKYNGSTWEHSLRKFTTATDTFRTLPVDIYADGNNATVGLKGNTVQSGTPTPDNPIMPEGTGDTTANLAYGKIDGANIGSNGTIFRADWYDIAIGRVESGIIYTINGFVLAFYTNEPTIDSVSYDGSRIVTTPGEPSTFTAPITGYVAFRLNPGEPAMLNTGSTALPYEPWGIKIPISSANTTTNVYLGEVESTRRVRKLVLTGEETVQTVGGNAPYRISVPGLKIPTLVQVLWMCSHYQAVPATASWAQYNSLISWNGGDGETLKFRDTSKADVNAFKAFLSSEYSNGTPVTIWYVLATEETAVVNEPLMKIDNYADTVSGITIPTITGKDTFDVLTTLKPSEVELTYTGWHDATVEEWDDSQWQ